MFRRNQVQPKESSDPVQRLNNYKLQSEYETGAFDDIDEEILTEHLHSVDSLKNAYDSDNSDDDANHKMKIHKSSDMFKSKSAYNPCTTSSETIPFAPFYPRAMSFGQTQSSPRSDLLAVNSRYILAGKIPPPRLFAQSDDHNISSSKQTEYRNSTHSQSSWLNPSIHGNPSNKDSSGWQSALPSPRSISGVSRRKVAVMDNDMQQSSGCSSMELESRHIVVNSTVDTPHFSIYSCMHDHLATQHVQCTIRRTSISVGSRSLPIFHLLLEQSHTPLLVARKLQMYPHSSYHLFDMSCGLVDPNDLCITSPSYIGKLKKSKKGNEFVLLLRTASGMYEELAGISYEKQGMLEQYMSSKSSPFRVHVIVPPVDNATMVPIPNNAAVGKSLLEMLRDKDSGRFYTFESKEPTLDNGVFQLDFKGRVKVASVKNFQVHASLF